MLRFNEKDHQYCWDDAPVVSVTQAIGQFIKVGRQYINIFTGAAIMADIFEAAGDWGRVVHNMIALWLEDDLDELALTPALTDTLEQFQRWMDEYKPEVISHEKRLFSKKYWYAGTYDLKCKIKGKLYIVDYKTGGFDMAGPQLAAYAQLDKENNPKTRSTRHRAVLHLKKNGVNFKFIEMKCPHDWDFFLCRLREHYYLTGR